MSEPTMEELQRQVTDLKTRIGKMQDVVYHEAQHWPEGASQAAFLRLAKRLDEIATGAKSSVVTITTGQEIP